MNAVLAGFVTYYCHHTTFPQPEETVSISGPFGEGLCGVYFGGWKTEYAEYLCGVVEDCLKQNPVELGSLVVSATDTTSKPSSRRDLIMSMNVLIGKDHATAIIVSFAITSEAYARVALRDSSVSLG